MSYYLTLQLRTVRPFRIVFILAGALLAAAGAASAQEATAAAPPAPPPPSSTVVLDPFEVKAPLGNTYTAIDSNSLTAFDISLNNMPATADILDQTLLSDTGIQSVEGAIAALDAGATYAATDVGATALARDQGGDHNANAVQVSIRGFSLLAGGMMTDGLQLNFGNDGATSFGQTSDYNVERIEIIDGPQALLYAGGGPGGAVNIVTKQAYFGQPAFGELDYRMDQYGSKYATFDFGASQGHLAIRLSLVDGITDGDRINVTNQLKGGDLQVALQVLNTTFRVTVQQSIDNRVDSQYVTLTSAGDPNFAPYTGYALETLLATQHAGGVLGGQLNWSNAESLPGAWEGDYDVSENAEIEADSTWTKWLSTKFAVAGANFVDDQTTPSITFYSPGATANTLPGNWTLAMGSPAFVDYWRPHINHSATYDVLLTNEFFGGSAKSQTSLEGDYSGNTNQIAHYSYYQSDSNGNAIVNSSVAPTSSNNYGRTLIPTQSWSINNGPILYPFFNPLVGTGSPKIINFQGNYYVRQLVTPFSETASGYGESDSEKSNGGYAILNDTTWMDGKLDTLVGLRYDHYSIWTPNNPSSETRKPDESVGLVYHLLPWLSPYVEVADLWEQGGTTLLNGSIAPDSHAVTEEVGTKIDTDQDRLSGSISIYHAQASNYTLSAPGVGADVSPTGLNGQIGPNEPTSDMAADIENYGFTASLTANPTQNWRIRLSAAWNNGKYTSGAAFNQFYNDQFHENSAGDVTYADGTVVYVPGTFNSKQLTVPSSTAGAVPLTVALLSTPTSQYYAAPQAITGAITTSSNGGRVLLSGASATDGAILTGATGLPISAYQLNPSLSGVTPVGTIDAAIPGDQMWGSPEYAVNMTAIYTFDSGPLNGFEIGGTVSAEWKYLAEYYYPSTSLLAPSDQLQFYLPSGAQFHLITGYSRKIGRFLWSVQLNVDNLFNHYAPILYPDVTAGFSVPTSVTSSFWNNPRVYTVTTRVRF